MRNLSSLDKKEMNEDLIQNIETKEIKVALLLNEEIFNEIKSLAKTKQILPKDIINEALYTMLQKQKKIDPDNSK